MGRSGSASELFYTRQEILDYLPGGWALSDPGDAGAWDPDKGSWQVLYSTEVAVNGSPREAPSGLEKEAIYTRKRIASSPIETYPDWQDERLETLHLNDRQSDQYIELCTEVFEDRPAHHLCGYPQPVQGNDMDLECQLVSNGLYCGDASGYTDSRAEQLKAGAPGVVSI